ncbi:MAG: FAD-dependent thymidylate synthase [Bacillota bacterium]
MPQVKQRVELVRHTADGEALTALAAKLCYAGGDVSALLERIQKNDQRAFIRKLLKMGHESVMEHISFTFLIEGVSRSLLAQLTRHRIASFSVQSQRYVGYENGFGYIVPPAVETLGTEAVLEYTAQMDQILLWYKDWQKKLGTNEDARFVLPNACETRLLMTMNVREIKHFLELRMCRRAQWEIRQLAETVFALCYAQTPELFAEAGPGCLRGACPEGKKSCGQRNAVRMEREEFITAHEQSNL